MQYFANIDRRMNKSGKEEALCYLCEVTNGKGWRKWRKRQYSKLGRRLSKSFMKEEFTLY